MKKEQIDLGVKDVPVVKQPPPFLKVYKGTEKEITYHLLDFENKFTHNNDEFVKKLLSKSIINKLKSESKLRLSEIDNYEIEMMSEVLQSDENIYDVLFPIVYINEDEVYFNEKTYEERRIILGDLLSKDYEEASEAVESFFDLKLPLALKNIQPYLRMMNGIRPLLPSS